MKILLVTEKYGSHYTLRDGGSKLVETLQKALSDSLSIMQFGPKADPSARWHFDYPVELPNRFEKRIANASFIEQKIRKIAQKFNNIIFIHISMQFGFANMPLQDGINVWTFPMFLTPSYVASGEIVPSQYIQVERQTLANSKNILTPSYLEKKQLIEFFSVPEERIHVVPRGVEINLLNPKVRHLSRAPVFCSLGSIKPQKNTIGLIRLFVKIYNRFPGSTLKIIGPVQNVKYFDEVVSEIKKFDLGKSIKFTGYVQPNSLALAIEDAHIHISTSLCETFGRVIFETLASGLPNLIISSKNNAAIDFLKNVPYARFTYDNDSALNILEEMFANFSILSSMALEIGELYNEEKLSKLLVAEICNNPNRDKIRSPDCFDKVIETSPVCYNSKKRG